MSRVEPGDVGLSRLAPLDGFALLMWCQLRPPPQPHAPSIARCRPSPVRVMITRAQIGQTAGDRQHHPAVRRRRSAQPSRRERKPAPRLATSSRMFRRSRVLLARRSSLVTSKRSLAWTAAMPRFNAARSVTAPDIFSWWKNVATAAFHLTTCVSGLPFRAHPGTADGGHESSRFRTGDWHKLTG